MDYNKLFEQIENTSARGVKGNQLACISRLVFYCGLRRKEIPVLKIRDVIDKDGKIIRNIQTFRKEIILNDEMAAEIQKYINGLSKQNPSLTNQTSWLFPSYRNERQLHRHWKKFNVKHIDIFHAGIKYYYSAARNNGIDDKIIFTTGSRQLRISEREFSAIVYGKKIQVGKTPDEQSSDKIMVLLARAENISHRGPEAKEEAIAHFK